MIGTWKELPSWSIVAAGVLVIVATVGLAGCLDGGEKGTDGGVDAGSGSSGTGGPADWSMPGFDAGNTASYGSPGGGEGEVLWQNTSNDAQSSPAIANGLVFVGETNRLSAWNVETGEQAWWFDDEPEPDEDGDPRFRTFSTPVVADGTVYAASRMSSEPGPSRVFALDAETGEEEWRVEVGNAVDSAPSVSDGLVFFGTQRIQGSTKAGQAAIHAVDADSGEEEWTFELGENPNAYASPIVSDGDVFVGTTGGISGPGIGDRVYKLDAQTGEEDWKAQISGTSSSVAVGDQTVFVDARDEVIALDAATGEEQWIHEDVEEIGADPTYADGTVYVADEDAEELVALDAATGEEVWVFEAAATPPAVAGDTVYTAAMDDGGNVTAHALDAATGDESWAADLGPADEAKPVAFADGTLFVTHEAFPEATISALDA